MRSVRLEVAFAECIVERKLVFLTGLVTLQFFFNWQATMNGGDLHRNDAKRFRAKKR
jgi:hypothetical protein